MRAEINVGPERVVLRKEGGSLRDVAQICTIAGESVARKPRSQLELIQWIADGGPWTTQDGGRTSDTLTVYLIWISTRKDFNVSVWESVTDGLTMYFQGWLKELNRGGATYDRLVGSKRSVRSVRWPEIEAEVGRSGSA